ncbi:MAG: mannitol dehydrogenase family protein [Anaerovoracaceae bacterium]
MKLNRQSITGENRVPWQKNGFLLPEFDIEEVRRETLQNPEWIHFGAGNIFRAFPAAVVQNLLERGEMKKGIVAVSGFSSEPIDRTYTPYDDLSVLVTMKADGSLEKRVIASIVKAVVMDRRRQEEFAWLENAFQNDSLQMASVTITEKGYKLIDAQGNYREEILEDFEAGPSDSTSYMGKLASLLYARFSAGKKPVAMVSMDNFSHNGDKLKESILTFASEWEKRGLAEEGFSDYLSDASKVSFPWTMIDKITPGPGEAVEEMLRNAGLEDAGRILTARKSWIAPFVNAEEPQYLVIEDSFPNGRPPLEKGGILLTEKETVDKVEKMKVCTCLNPLHTALAVFGCLLSYDRISEEMKDPLLKRMVYRLGYEEGMPVVVHPGILDPEKFLAEVLEERIPNPFLPDTPQRIAMDTSQKIPIRFGETLKAYMADETKDVNSLIVIPLVIAGWCRYLMAVDDAGKPFEPSPDPLYAVLKPHLNGIELGNAGDYGKALQPILSNRQIFAVDLYEAGIADRVLDYFGEMTTRPGAVRKTLEKYIGTEDRKA